MSAAGSRVALTLRHYQQEAITAVERALDRGLRRPMIVLPTGTGKTCIVASPIERRGGSALVLAHRDELLRQAAAKIALADPTLGLGVGFAAQRDDVGAPVVVGSVQTLAQTQRLKRLPRQFDTVIVDECVTGDTLVMTDRGRIPIRKVHETGGGQALSYADGIRVPGGTRNYANSFTDNRDSAPGVGGHVAAERRDVGAGHRG